MPKPDFFPRRLRRRGCFNYGFFFVFRGFSDFGVQKHVFRGGFGAAAFQSPGMESAAHILASIYRKRITKDILPNGGLQTTLKGYLPMHI